jgi:NADH-quinone oxidoreductase subunit E
MSLLSDHSVALIADLRRSAPSAQCALLTALRLTQQERRHVGVEEVEDLATLLGLSPALVDGVARFYDQLSREPTGRHVVSLCRGIACYLRGSGARAEQLQRALGVGPGATAADGRVTFRLVECIGDCAHAPAVMLDDVFLGAAEPGELLAVLERPASREGGEHGADSDVLHRA